MSQRKCMLSVQLISIIQARSSPLKNVTESVLKEKKSFLRISCHRKIMKNVGWKRVCNFLGKDEKHGEISTYFCLKHRCDYPPF